MSWTKRQIIEKAFEEIGLANYTFDLKAEQLQSALERLDAMVSTWKSRGVVVDYVVPSTIGGSDLDDDSDVDDHMEALYTNLAIKIAPMVGKTPSKETKRAAFESYQELLTRTVTRSEKQYPDNLPVGQGNFPWRRVSEYFSESSSTTTSTNTAHPMLTLATGAQDFIVLDVDDQILDVNPLNVDDVNISGTPSAGTVVGYNATTGLFQWTTPAGSGDVVKVGTPVDNQVGVWTGDGTIEGTTNFTFNNATTTLTVTGSIAVTGTVDGRNLSADGTKLDFISVTQAVDLDTIESDTATNNAKISYTDAAAVAANTAKVSADGSVGTHSDVNIAAATGSTASTLRVLADHNTDGTYDVIDWTPPTGGEANTTSNDGAGEGLAKTKSGVDLPFKSLVGGTNVTLASDADTVTINSTAGGGNVSNTGTPVDGQIAIFTDATTIEGDPAFTFDTTDDTLVIGAGGKLAFGAVDVLSDSAGTATLQNIDALDATTESTIETAIDTLANLTSVQGHTVTLTGDLIRSGAHSLTITTTGSTSVTLPTSGTLATTSVATETTAGLVERATQAEVNAGADATRYVSPDTLEGLLNGNATITGGQYDGSQTSLLGTITGVDIDCGTGIFFEHTVAGSVTFTLSNIPASPNVYVMRLRIIFTSGSVTWTNFTNLEWAGTTAPSFTAGEEYDIILSTDDAGSNWRGIANEGYA